MVCGRTTWEKKRWYLGRWENGPLSSGGLTDRWWRLRHRDLLHEPWESKGRHMQRPVNGQMLPSPFQKTWLSFPHGLWVPRILCILTFYSLWALMDHFSFFTVRVSIPKQLAPCSFWDMEPPGGTGFLFPKALAWQCPQPPRRRAAVPLLYHP